LVRKHRQSISKRDAPHHSIAIPRDALNTIYVGGDAGVFVSTDAGRTWMNHTRNLPSVMVVDLFYQLRDGSLSAATYGRSMWRLRVK
jgi:ligand-binding sensor domain-containing protein